MQTIFDNALEKAPTIQSPIPDICARCRQPVYIVPDEPEPGSCEKWETIPAAPLTRLAGETYRTHTGEVVSLVGGRFVIVVYCADCAASLVYCRVCGCTAERACAGGCCWREPDLCSRCAGTNPSQSDRAGGLVTFGSAGAG